MRDIDMRACGPESVVGLRGRLAGREVVLLCCGEAHEDVVDLTRRGGVPEPVFGWVPHLEGAPASAMGPSTLVPGSSPPSPSLAPCAVLIWISSACVR